MAKYSGKTFEVNHSVYDISDKFSDLTQLQSMIDKLPPEEKEKVKSVQLEPDSISIMAPQLGAVKFKVIERTPEHIVMNAEGTPVPLGLSVDLEPVECDKSNVTCSVNVEIPAILKPIVGPQLQKAVDMLSSVIQKAVS